MTRGPGPCTLSRSTRFAKRWRGMAGKHTGNDNPSRAIARAARSHRPDAANTGDATGGSSSHRGDAGGCARPRSRFAISGLLSTVCLLACSNPKATPPDQHVGAMDAGCPPAGPCQEPKAGSPSCETLALSGPKCDAGDPQAAGVCWQGQCLPPSCAVAAWGQDLAPECAGLSVAGDGSCKVEAHPGQECDLPPDPWNKVCLGTTNHCDGLGRCRRDPLVGKACGVSANPCAELRCDVDGSCTSQPVAGKACSQSADNPCAQGICGTDGWCHQTPKAGGSCTLATDACHVGQCSKAGICVPTPNPGAACDAGPCNKGTCNQLGNCAPQPLPGLACPLKTDVCHAGVCDAAGKCVPVVTPGANCDAGPCNKGTCDAQGVCQPQSLPGKACLMLTDGCHKGICSPQGVCEALPKTGAPCAMSECMQGTCDEAGKCAAKPLVGAPCGSSGDPCLAGKCGLDGSCEMVPVPGAACGQIGCTSLFCDSQGKCTVEKVSADATPCKKGSDQCSAGLCSAGKCVPGPWPCTPTGGYAIYFNPCLKGTCAADGSCTVSVMTGAPCQADAPTKCRGTSGICSAQGLCEAQPTPGVACSLGTCMSGVCDAAGACKVVPQVGAFCGGSECAPAYCDANHQCVPSVQVGKVCGTGGTACVPMLCQADGSCAKQIAPPGTACTGTAVCRSGPGLCDGKGGCVVPAQVGADCSKLIAYFASACIGKATCSASGACVTEIAVGAPCSTQCIGAGICDKAGVCQGKLTAQAGGPCRAECGQYGQCGADGRCHVSPNQQCYPPSECRQCSCKDDGTRTIAMQLPDGSTCATDGNGCLEGGQCVDGVCAGQEKPSGCEDGNICTYDICCLHDGNVFMQKTACMTNSVQAGHCTHPSEYADYGVCQQEELCLTVATCWQGKCGYQKSKPGCYNGEPMCYIDCSAYVSPCASYACKAGKCTITQTESCDPATGICAPSDAPKQLPGACEGAYTCLHNQCILAKPGGP